MLLRFFRGGGFGEVFFISLAGLLVWAYAFYNPHLSTSFNYDTSPMPLYSLFKNITGNSALLGVIFTFGLVMLMSFLIVNFNTSQFFINERTFLPGAIYILITGIFPDQQMLNPVLPASIFLMIAIRRIMDAYRKPGTAYNFFDASVLIGTGSLLYANLIWFALLVIIGIAILRTGNVKELIISVIGLITPPLVTAGIYYAIGKDISSLPLLLYNNLFLPTVKYDFSTLAIAGLIVLGLIALISLVYLLSVMNIKKIKSRKTFTELNWALVITFVVYFTVPSASVELVWLAAIPLSYIMAHYFIFSRKKLFPEIFFAVMILVVAFFQIWYLKQT
jgi:hypothetical protein